MPCSNPVYTGTRRDDFPWENFTRSVRYNVESYFEPDSLRNLVWILQEAEALGKRVKAIGSGWSLPNIATSHNWVVDLSNLNNRLTYLIDLHSASDSLTAARRAIHLDPSREKYIHIEAGIKIFDLNNLLQSRGLSMITLGGAQGQKLAGAISTSTHGSDLDNPPLPDLVQAVHLVTSGGKELWIESSSDPLTDNDAALRSVLPCPEIEIIRNDDLLNAVIVGVGRFGVIYSFVLKVTQLFRLAEWTQVLPWSEVSASLRSGVGLAGRDVFTNLDALLSSPPPELGINVMPREYRFLDITLNPRRNSTCWVRRNWTTNEASDLNLEESNNILCHHGVANLVLVAASAALSTYAVAVLAIPIYGAVKSALINAHAARLLAMSFDPHMTGGHALATAANAVWDSQISEELKWLIELLNQIALDTTFSQSIAAGKRGVNWNITSGTRESAFDRNCYNGQSVEMIFSLSNGNYIDYIDFLLRESNNYLYLGYVSVRFSHRSNGLISMHNVDHDLAVSIEITSLDGLRDSRTWLDLIERRGIEMGGRPHWGQQNSLRTASVNALYGRNVIRWREKLSEIVGLNPMFSNDFTNQRGLEPINIPRIIRGVRKERGTITHLCNEGQFWSPVSTATAIAEIKRGTPYFYVEHPSGRIRTLVLTHYLSTDPDDTTENNLRSLPDVPMPGYGSPPAALTRRRITSITVEAEGSIPGIGFVSYMHNDEERWSVRHTIAFVEVYEGRIEYYIQNADGAVTLLEAREYLRTFANESEADNLDNLPAC